MEKLPTGSVFGVPSILQFTLTRDYRRSTRQVQLLKFPLRRFCEASFFKYLLSLTPITTRRLKFCNNASGANNKSSNYQQVSMIVLSSLRFGLIRQVNLILWNYLNQMSHRYVSGVLRNDWNDPLDFRSLDDVIFELVWVIKRSLLSFPVYITKKMLVQVITWFFSCNLE